MRELGSPMLSVPPFPALPLLRQHSSRAGLFWNLQRAAIPSKFLGAVLLRVGRPPGFLPGISARPREAAPHPQSLARPTPAARPASPPAPGTALLASAGPTWALLLRAGEPLCATCGSLGEGSLSSSGVAGRGHRGRMCAPRPSRVSGASSVSQDLGFDAGRGGSPATFVLLTSSCQRLP